LVQYATSALPCSAVGVALGDRETIEKRVIGAGNDVICVVTDVFGGQADFAAEHGHVGLPIALLLTCFCTRKAAEHGDVGRELKRRGAAEAGGVRPRTNPHFAAVDAG